MYIGIISILEYQNFNFVLPLDLMPYVPTIVFLEILIALFICSAVVAFRTYREYTQETTNYNESYARYLTHGPNPGKTNENYAESESPSELDLYKSLQNRGFDLQPVANIDPVKEIDDFERTISKNPDYTYTY